MDKESAIEDFLKNLSKAIKVTSLYSRDHPLFLKTVANFKKEVDATLDVLTPIKIGFSIDSLFIEGKVFSKATIYEELAKIFHMRRVKTIEIKKGITFDELSIFLNKMSLSPREIFRQGGIAKILNKENTKYLSAEELDYYQLLKGEGGEYKDIWTYLLKDVLQQDDHRKALELANNFERVIRHFTSKDILQDDELYENLHNFLEYLHLKIPDSFSNCSKEIARHILQDKDVYSKEHIERIKELFKSLNDKDIADILSDKILNEDNFDSLSFNLFSKMFAEGKHKEVAQLTTELINTKFLGDKRKIRDKIEKLFLSEDNTGVSQIYHQTLLSLVKDFSYSNAVTFDREQANVNYRMIILTLLSQEENQMHIKVILEKISKELKNITSNNDFNYLKLLVDILKAKKRHTPEINFLLDDLNRQVYNFVENISWLDEPPGDLEYFIENIEFSSLGLDLYLDRIFNEGKVNTYVLRLFLKFFPGQLPIFYRNLEKRCSDMEFIGKIIRCLKDIDKPNVLDILKQIYLFSNSLIKIEILKAMQELSVFDKEFLFSVLKKGDIPLKKEALLALAKDENTRREAFKELLFTPGIWGRQNKILSENIIVVEEAGLEEARDYLIALNKKLFFWNWDIKNRIRTVLKKWTH